jgi:hypothetical protein
VPRAVLLLLGSLLREAFRDGSAGLATQVSGIVVPSTRAVLPLLEVCFVIDFLELQYRPSTIKVPGEVLPAPGLVLPFEGNLDE